MMLRIVLPGLMAAACLLWTGVVSAQTVSASPRRHTFEVTAGVAWFGAVTLGTGSADLTKNQTPPSPYPIFKTDSSVASAAGFDGRLAFALTRQLAIEGGFSYAGPMLDTSVSGDVEGAPAVTATERLSQYRRRRKRGRASHGVAIRSTRGAVRLWRRRLPAAGARA